MRATFLLGLLSLVLACPVQAKVFTFSNLDLQCEVPDSWTFRNLHGDIVNAMDPTNRKLFRIHTVVATIPNGSLDNAQYLQNFEPTYLAEGYTILTRGKVDLHGTTFYRWTMSKDAGQGSLGVVKYFALANGYCYWIDASEKNGNPDDDLDIQAIYSSVEFINPPVLPRTFWASNRLFVALVLLALLAVFALLVLGIAVGIYFLSKSKSASPAKSSPL